MRFRKPPAALRQYLPLMIGAVVVALLLGVGIGRVTGQVPTTDAVDDDASAPAVSEDGHIHGGSGDVADGDESGDALVGGLSLSEAGFTLVPHQTRYSAKDAAQRFAFEIIDAQGMAITNFATVHQKQMHMFVVRRDLSGFQHLHPSLSDDGVWETEITTGAAGMWRVIADFAVESGDEPTALTLGADLAVPGDFTPEPLPEPADKSSVAEFDVSMEFEPEIGVTQPALLTVTDDGEPAELQPYLGAFGHLVMLRADDLAFSHVHPDAEQVDGAQRFWTTVPSTGRYRLFLDFQVADTVHTADFTLTVPA